MYLDFMMPYWSTLAVHTVIYQLRWPVCSYFSTFNTWPAHFSIVKFLLFQTASCVQQAHSNVKTRNNYRHNHVHNLTFGLNSIIFSSLDNYFVAKNTKNNNRFKQKETEFCSWDDILFEQSIFYILTVSHIVQCFLSQWSSGINDTKKIEIVL